MATLLHQKNYMKSLSNVSGGTEPTNDDNDDDLLNSSLLGGMPATADFLDHHQSSAMASSTTTDMIPLGQHSSSSSFNDHSHHYTSHSNHNYFSQNNSYFNNFQSTSGAASNSSLFSNSVLSTGSTTTGTYSNHLLNNGHSQSQQSQTNQHPNQSHSSSFLNPPHLILNSNLQPPPPHLIHNQNFYIKREINEESNTTIESTQNGDNSSSNIKDELDENSIVKTEIDENHEQMVDDTLQSQPATTESEDQEPQPEIDIVINNVVCSFAVRCHLNLKEIALNGCNVEFRRENGMVTMKLRKPYTTASMWSSGRITCTGATSEEQVSFI